MKELDKGFRQFAEKALVASIAYPTGNKTRLFCCTMLMIGNTC